MSNEVKSNSRGGIGFCGLLTIVFITLKLTHFINWSWWWVLSPLWIPLIIVLSIIFIWLAYISIKVSIEHYRYKLKNKKQNKKK